MNKIIKIYLTAEFLKSISVKPKTVKEIREFIIQTWGNEIYLQIKSGEKDFIKFMDYMNLNGKQKEKMLKIINQFLDHIRNPHAVDRKQNKKNISSL